MKPQPTVKQLMKQYENGEVNWYSGEIAPFPGKYPTHMALYVDHAVPGGRGVKFEYIGKPSPSKIRQFRNALQQDAYWSYAIEFDRKNVIAVWRYIGAYPRLEMHGWRVAPVARNATLWRVYYPWDGLNRMLYMHMQPWWPKRVGGIPCYSPKQTLALLAEIAPHRAWLRRRGLLREQRTNTNAA